MALVGCGRGVVRQVGAAKPPLHFGRKDSSTVDFGFNEEQEMLRQSARGLLEKECPTAIVRRLMDDARGCDPALWKTIAGLGWIGLVLPESFGGAGLGWVDLVVVLEEMGRVVLPAPFIWTVLFAEAVNRAGSPAMKSALLPMLAAGELIATLAWMEPAGGWNPDAIVMPAVREDTGFRLEGVKLYVPDAHVAGQILVAARTSGEGARGITLFAIDAQRSGVAITPLKTMDQTRKLSEVRFTGVHVEPEEVVGEIDEGWKVLSAVIDRGKLMLAAEMMGGAQKVLETTVEYAKIRTQFGRPIGAFQAIQHKCSNMLVDIEGAKSAVYYAAWALSNQVADAPLAAAVAKAAASDAFRRAAADGIQVHGGIGFTWEHDMHLYFKRAKSSEFTFGDASYNRELVAQQIGL
jgi:alkylation response protein AidB-like acyl-CoA dehydrogenase